MVKIPKIYQKHFLVYEFIISMILSLAIIFAIQYYPPFLAFQNLIIINKSELFSTIATISGTLFGFTITGFSIIAALSDSEKLKLLKKSKHYKTIYSIYFHTIGHLALTTIIATFGILSDPTWTIMIFYLLIWSIAISAFRIMRSLWILQELVTLTK